MWRQEDWKYPHASALGASGLSLPTYPELTFDQVHEIAGEFISAYNQVG
jgi:dTDP-4-amino-4,6-dideoxygalactose transaminase